MQQDISGAWISVDGRWRWDGQAWVPWAQPPPVPVPLSIGDVISLPTRDPRWFGKCGIEGLISLIPIYGSFEIIGWLLSYLDNLRAGRAVLPEAGFGYARRGARVASVALIYSVIGVATFYLVFGGLAFLLVWLAPPSTSTNPGSVSSGGAFPAVFFAGFFGLQSAIFLLYALLYFLIVPIVLRTERHGVAAGLNLWAAFKMATEDLQTAAVAALLLFLAAFIGGIGVYACLVGVVFSYGFAAAMVGAAIRWYEEHGPTMG